MLPTVNESNIEQLELFGEDGQAPEEETGFTENPDDMTLVIKEAAASSPIENWALKELRNGRPMAGIFSWEDRVDVLQAWEQVQGSKYRVTAQPAVAILQDGTTLDMKDRKWLFPTWDGREHFITDKQGDIRKSVAMVSDHFEVIQPSDAIQVLYNNMVDAKGNPLRVTAIAASNDLREVVIQWQTGSIEVKGDIMNRYVAARISLIGSIVGAFFDVRFLCMNKMPLLMSNAQFAITHRAGANERLQDKFSGMMNMFNISQGLHDESYNVLASIDMNEDDEKYIVERMYPYQLPKGYTQSTNTATVRELVYLGRAPRKNLKAMEYRALARFGIAQAVSDTGNRTLWEGSQANFAANFRMTRSYAAQATQLAFEGGDRRDEAVRGFQAALVLASKKGYRDRLPEQMVIAAENSSMISGLDDDSAEVSRLEKNVQLPMW